MRNLCAQGYIMMYEVYTYMLLLLKDNPCVCEQKTIHAVKKEKIRREKTA